MAGGEEKNPTLNQRTKPASIRTKTLSRIEVAMGFSGIGIDRNDNIDPPAAIQGKYGNPEK
jgi:hypothetical protein